MSAKFASSEKTRTEFECCRRTQTPLSNLPSYPGRESNPHDRNDHRILSAASPCKTQQNATKGNKMEQNSAFIAHQKRAPTKILFK